MERVKQQEEFDLEVVRTLIARHVPGFIDKVVQDYSVFQQQATPETVKEIAAYHAAGKSALAHLEALIKLMKWCEGGSDISTSVTEEDDDVSVLLKQARFAVANLEGGKDVG